MSDRNNLIRSAINASKLSVENLYMQQWGHAWVNRYVRMLVILLDCLVTCSTTDIGSVRKTGKCSRGSSFGPFNLYLPMVAVRLPTKHLQRQLY